jgi:class 3 adenylate cyclase
MSGGADAMARVPGIRVKTYAHWSIRTKLMALLLLLALTTLAVCGTIAYVKQRKALADQTFNQLTGITRTKRSQIEAYYQTIQNHVSTLSSDRMFIDAMRDFKKADEKMNRSTISASVMNAVHENYRDQFYPEIQRLHMARQNFQAYLPVTPAAIRLQYLYIVKNPFPKGSRDKLIDPGDGSEYSAVHRKYHVAFRAIIQKFGYYDLYLIDAETGQQVYDVSKDRDFATSLKEGPYANSNLAKVMNRCLETRNPDEVFFSDFEPYEASQGEPTQYVASPIFDGDELLGILALQLSTKAIDLVMTGDHGWVREGLGQTGESILVGPDFLPRSDIRSYLEDPDGFLARLQDSGSSEETIARIRTFNTTILQLPLKLPSVEMALQGEQGVRVGRDSKFLGASLVSYMPVHIENLHWALISRETMAEAFKPVRDLKWVFSGWGAVLLLLTSLAAWLVARQILKPINALVDAAEKVAAGDLTAKVDWKSNDELGILADTFNSMTKSIREKTEIIEQKSRENEALLLNILPGEIANRLKNGEQEIADAFADVTVLFGDIVGFTALSSNTSAGSVVEMLNGLFSRFDELAQNLGIEKIKTIGDCYMAVCGMPKLSPDHAPRMARMALQMLEVTRTYGKTLGIDLALRIGINSGPVVAGVIGTTKFIYDLWGDTVNLASRMESTGVPGQIQVMRKVHDQLEDTFLFEYRGFVKVKGKGEIETWILKGEQVAAEVHQ